MGGLLFRFADAPFMALIDILAILIALTVHEWAHAKMADKLGDPTPRLQGRVTLDPRAHLDPIGTLLILFVGFGWGKPVRFDPYNLENPRQDGMKIAFAGPASNIIMAFATSLILKVTLLTVGTLNPYVAEAFLAFITLNIFLAIFNLLPVEPLDGFKVVAGLLPDDQAEKWQTLAPYGMFFLIILLFPIGGGQAPGIMIVSTVSRWILQFLL